MQHVSDVSKVAFCDLFKLVIRQQMTIKKSAISCCFSKLATTFHATVCETLASDLFFRLSTKTSKIFP